MNIHEAYEAYFQKFGKRGPKPISVTDTEIKRVLIEHIDSDKPIPDDYDWYADLPEGAVP